MINWIKNVWNLRSILQENEDLKKKIEASKNEENSLLQNQEQLYLKISNLEGDILTAANNYSKMVGGYEAKVKAQKLEISLLKGRLGMKKETSG